MSWEAPSHSFGRMPSWHEQLMFNKPNQLAATFMAYFALMDSVDPPVEKTRDTRGLRLSAWRAGSRFDCFLTSLSSLSLSLSILDTFFSHRQNQWSHL